METIDEESKFFQQGNVWYQGYRFLCSPHTDIMKAMIYGKWKVLMHRYLDLCLPIYLYFIILVKNT